MPQTIGAIASQDTPLGQQRRVVFEARVMQSVPKGQQKSEGKPDSQAIKLPAAHFAEVVVMRRVRVASNARARPRGLRSCFRIAVVTFCVFEYMQVGFQALKSVVEGRSLSKFSSQVIFTVDSLFESLYSSVFFTFQNLEDRRIPFGVPYLQK